MKRITFLTLSACIFSLFCSGCQSVSEFLVLNKPTKVVSPAAPYLDENIEVIDEHMLLNVNRSANITGKAARVPVKFWDKVTRSFRGESDENPYDRADPYGLKDYQGEALAEHLKGITQPTYMRGEKYAKAYRSPFIFKEELARGGTSEMITIGDASSSLLAKQYLDFQKDLENDLDRAESYLNEGKYGEALELVDKVMDMDSSTQRGRILFEKIIRERENDKIRQEEAAKIKIANSEKISKYMVEAREYLEKYNFEEALRVAEKAVHVDPTHEGARELVDTIEVAKFEYGLKESGTSSLEILERMIYKHLTLYQQYSNENLTDLAKKELQKVSILESYRDKLSSLG